MSGNLQVGTTTYSNLLSGHGNYVTATDTIAEGDEHVAGEVLGRELMALDDVVPGDNNAGDGEVEDLVLGNGAKIGNYGLTCKAASPTLEVEEVVEGVANVGDGTIAPEAITLGARAVEGDYVFTCTEAPSALEATGVVSGLGNSGNGTIVAEDIEVGAGALPGDYLLTCLTADSELGAGAPVSSGAPTMLDGESVSTVVLGPKAQVGIYLATCISAEGTPTWQVRSPAGGILPNALSDTPYSNPQIAFTIVNGGTPGDTITVEVTQVYGGGGTFQVDDPSGDRLADATVSEEYVGGGLTFTIVDGETPFEPGDTLTITVERSQEGGGKFGVVDPTGDLLAPATVGVEYQGGGLTLTISEGDTTPFAVGDTLTVTVAAVEGEVAGAWSVVDPDGIALRDATTGVEYEGPVGFTLTEGDTPFEPGDTFILPVVAGSGLLKLLDKAARDGSQIPVGVLAEDVDASDDNAPCVIWRSGGFNIGALIFAEGTAYNDARDALATLGITARASL